MNRSKEEARRKKRIGVLIIIAVVIVLLVAAVLMLRRSVAERYGAAADEDVLSEAASIGSIVSTVSASGNLADEDVEDIILPYGVEIEELFVAEGDRIEEGDLLATLDMASVLSTMSALQDEIDSIDSQIASASTTTVDDTIYSTVIGRVKAIYAETGRTVSSVMSESGALMLLSMDGYMAVDIECDTLAAGDTVYVESPSGFSYTGTVDDIDDGITKILVSDDGPLNGDTVKVSSADGTLLGEGELYINEPLSVTGYAGTITGMYVQENALVYLDCPLIYISNTGFGGDFNSLLTDRKELEDLLQDLVVIYKEGALSSHISGSVTSVTDIDTLQTDLETLQKDNSSLTIFDTQVVMSVCPDEIMTLSVSVDESDILSLSIGQEATVTVDSIEDETFPAELTTIETTGTSSNGVTYYTVEVTLDKTAQMLSGMSASVLIRIEGVDNALLIPSDALHQTSTMSYVYTSYDTTTGEYGGMKEVTVGLNNGDYVEITSGLNEGDVVYYVESEEDVFDFRAMQRMQGGGMPGGGEMPAGGGMQGGGMPANRG